MIKIFLTTGSAFHVETITCEGDLNSDLIECINNYYQEHGDLPVILRQADEYDEQELEIAIPINGGEFYIDGINLVQEIEQIGAVEMEDTIKVIVGIVCIYIIVYTIVVHTKEFFGKYQLSVFKGHAGDLLIKIELKEFVIFA